MFPELDSTYTCFFGSEEKKHYLIWREKNGFFTALKRDGRLHTWSLVTGKHLFE
jgi:hypothetical protein